MAAFCKESYKQSDVSSLTMLAGASCAFGVFDGLHRGHQFIIDQAKIYAQQQKIASYVITFDMDPDEYFNKADFKKIMSNEARIAALAQSGVTGVIVLAFADFCNLEAGRFLDTLFSMHTPACINVGCDVAFGKHAQGNITDLVSWGTTYNMDVKSYELVTENACPITSTRIRTLLGDGEIEQANELLGHHYVLEELVVRGRGDGADMGFRTANIEVAHDRFILKEGVYAARVDIEQGSFKAAVSVGVSPTFATTSRANVEVHILDYHGDLYGKTIRVSFIERLRDMVKFADVDDLIAQVMRDIDQVRRDVVL